MATARLSTNLPGPTRLPREPLSLRSRSAFLPSPFEGLKVTEREKSGRVERRNAGVSSVLTSPALGRQAWRSLTVGRVSLRMLHISCVCGVFFDPSPVPKVGKLRVLELSSQRTLIVAWCCLGLREVITKNT